MTATNRFDPTLQALRIGAAVVHGNGAQGLRHEE